ncbi:MAG TPA: ester cyclase [Herpetosiphonaceae bacterium]
MLLEENKAVVRRFVEEVLNQKNMASAGQLVDSNGVDQLKASLTMYLVLTAFPDFRVNIEHMIAEDDKVTVLSTFSGTHKGEFMGIPGTGKGVTGKMTNSFRIAQGKIVESRQTYDPWGLVQQIAPNAFSHVASSVD